MQIAQDSLHPIPFELLLECRAAPLEKPEPGLLKIAVSEGTILEPIELAAQVCGLALQLVEVSQVELRRLLTQLEASSLAASGASSPPAKAVNIVAGTGAVYRYLEQLLGEALTAGASDVHLEPVQDAFQVRKRIDGRLHRHAVIDAEMGAALVAQIKVQSLLVLSETRLPQDGRFSFACNDRSADVRVSILPSLHGEAVVMRLLENSRPLDLKALGLMPRQLDLLKQRLVHAYGLLLCAGPTGSGKTTTLYSILQELNLPGRKLLSVEDPVEVMIPGVNQVQVSGAGVTFASAIRAMLRHAPEVIMVGEIRDSQTAAAACEAALSGHMVLASVHARDAAEAAVRLTGLGVPRYVVASVLSLAIGQRLLRRVCESCAVSSQVDTSLLKLLGIQEMTSARATGCPKCRGTGYRGRTGIYETLTFSPAVKAAYIGGGGAERLRDLQADSGEHTLLEAAAEKVKNRETTPEEAVNATSLDV